MQIPWESFEFCFSVNRFSSGDLSAEVDDVESQSGEAPAGSRPIPPPLQTQPMPGGPPNIPPPPGLLTIF